MLKYIKKGDIILSLSLIILSLVLAFFTLRQGKSAGETYATISQDGKEIMKIDFDEVKPGETVRIDSEYGYNVFEIGDKKIRSIDADCKEKIHIKQGWISKPGQSLVCLPHRLVVEIKTSDNDEQGIIDHINY